MKLLIVLISSSLTLAILGLFYGLYTMIDIDNGKMRKPDPERLKTAWAITTAGLIHTFIWLSVAVISLICPRG